MDDNTGIDFSSIDLDDALGSDFEPTLEATDAEPEAPAEPEQPESGVEAAPPTPDQEEAPQQPESFNPEGPGNIREALRQEREAARAAKAERDALFALVQQMQATPQAPQAQPTSAEPPDIFEDPQAAIAFYVQQATQPLQEKVAAYEQMTRALEAEREIAQLEASHPGAKGYIAEFDAVLPGLAQSWTPTSKLAHVLGAKLLDPVHREGLLQPHLKAALDKAAAQLKPQTPQAPKTLGNLPAAASSAPADSTLKPGDIKRLGLNALDLL